ncbi:MAG TPA: hypothetical protein VEC99_05265 [Clostridia bacterium]|nr:hypothetical protein [Clostridia bacterium]
MGTSRSHQFPAAEHPVFYRCGLVQRYLPLLTRLISVHSLWTSALALWLCASAHGQVSNSLANVIPTGHALGTGWHREIEVLIDPLSKPPAEIIHPTEQISESTLNEWRRSVRDPNYHLSGWIHARFDFLSGNTTNRYHLRVERYRSEAVLRKAFAPLLKSDSLRQRSIARKIGDAAVVTREQGTTTLSFRRGHFRVSVSSFNNTPSEEKNGSLRHLAEAVDRCITNTAARPK